MATGERADSTGHISQKPRHGLHRIQHITPHKPLLVDRGCSQNSKIEWTEATWNPITGCTKISPGCKHCYAERMAKRLQAMGVPQYRTGFRLAMHPGVLTIPLNCIKPRTFFVNSMSDLFHKNVPLDFIKQVFEVMQSAPQHTFQVLTKRPEIASSYAAELPWPENVWLGASVENAMYTHRIKSLASIPAHIRFLSIESLLGPILRFCPLTACIG